jgi:myosin heavy subunit
MAKDDVKDGTPETDVADEVELDADTGDQAGDGEEASDAAEQSLSDEQEGGAEEVTEEEERPSRAQTRFQRLANEAREANEKAERLERRLAEVERNSRPAASVEESPEQEAQRLALMTPEERLEYKLDKAERRNQQQLRQIQYQTAENSDKQNFQLLCSTDPTAKRYAQKVEETRNQLMRENGGMPIAREAILDVLIGRDVRANRAKGVDAARNKGQQNINRQKGRPVNSRGDAEPQRRRQGSTPADRLDGVEI